MTVTVGGVAASNAQKTQILSDLGAMPNTSAAVTAAVQAATTGEKSSIRTALSGPSQIGKRL